MTPVLRPYQAHEAPALAALYRDAARVTGATAYLPAQVEAWASSAEDEAAFAAMLAGGNTLVCTLGGQIAGFGQLHPADHLALLYTAPDWGRRGVGRLLCAALEACSRVAGTSRLSTTASRLSRPLFEARGWTLDAIEHNLHRGVAFERFRMSKILGQDA